MILKELTPPRGAILAFAFAPLITFNTLAQSGTEKISLQFQNITLKEAIPLIEKASGYIVNYNATVVNSEQKVSMDAKNQEIRLAIRTMLEPSDITFHIKNKQIQLERKQVEETTKKGVSKRITGTILDQQGEPIIGATVTIKGTVTGALSDLDGKYTIQAKEGEVLEYRYIGYNSVEQKVKNVSTINITLAESNINLDDVVVVGYGSQKKV